MSSIAVDDIKDKVMVSEIRRSLSERKPNGTPVKMLIAQEMSKELKLKQSSPNVVAKLMGLDALPKQQPDRTTQRSHSKWYTRKCHSEIPIGYWMEEASFIPKKFNGEIRSSQVQNEFKDIHEIVRNSQRTNVQRDESPQKGRSNENANEKKLCLIRQKFIEAKRLATDEKLRQTKEFQDALDFLSSSGDLFLKVLQEPNSIFTQQSYEEPCIPPSPETKRITVLRPSKMIANDKCSAPARIDEKQVKKQFQVNQINLCQNHPDGFSPTISTWKVNDSPTQPTRIVVLKPSPTKVNGLRTPVSSTLSSPRASKCENCFGGHNEESRDAREVAREITQQMRQNLAVRRDETLLSSVFSNGYTGDESSFEKSVNGFADDENLSDSEVISPISRHSWDYVNRFRSPYSVSSFSQASYSPESSVCREAKKRLSERWAIMSSNCSNLDQRQFHRSSSTLGEMLALSEIKKPEICEEESDNRDEGLRASSSFLNRSVGASESREDSPRDLSRSKSVPISPTAYGERLNVEVSDVVVRKVDTPKEIVNVKAAKTSFTGKVTRLFFSNNKKSKKEKSHKLQSNDESLSLAPPERISNDHSEVVPSHSGLRSGTVLVDINDKRLGQGFHQGAVSGPQPCTPVIQGGKHDHPSPISVLEQLFEEDECAMQSCSLSFEPHENTSSLSRSKFNLIDKSPPIGSLSRTMSWDECHAETATSYPIDTPFVVPESEKDVCDWLCLVQSLLTMAGLNNEGQVSFNLARWHTPESPLDPLLRDKFIDLSAEEPLHKSKRRRLRSTRKLVFDSVNATLVDITGLRTPSSQWSASYGGTHSRFLENCPSTSLTDKVWAQMKEWVSGEIGEDSNSQIERLVMKEVVDTGRIDQYNFEIDNISKEIEGKLLEELVEETLVEWTGRI